MKRTIVIGDLQGCYKEAVKLLELCEAKPDDHVIFTGDLLDRGPDNDLCVELARERERMQKAPRSAATPRGATPSASRPST